MKEMIMKIETSKEAMQFEKLAEEMVATRDGVLFEEYKNFRNTRLLLLLLFIIPGIIFHCIASKPLYKKIRERYKDQIQNVINKYAEKHPGVSNPVIKSYDGKISKSFHHSILSEWRGRGWKRKRKDPIDLDEARLNSYRSDFRMFDTDEYEVEGIEEIRNKRSSAPLMDSSYLEALVNSFDMGRYFYTTRTNARVFSSIDAGSIFTRVNLRNDVELDLDYKGIDLRITNCLPLIRYVTKHTRRDKDGRTTTTYHNNMKNGAASLVIAGNTGTKLPGSFIISANDFLTRPDDHMNHHTLEKEPFESMEFNEYHDVARGNGLSEVALFKAFPPRVIDKFDQFRQDTPGFALSIKANGDFLLSIGSYLWEDIPFSLDKPAKYIKNKQYAVDLIKSDMIYLNSAFRIIDMLGSVGMFKLEK